MPLLSMSNLNRRVIIGATLVLSGCAGNEGDTDIPRIGENPCQTSMSRAVNLYGPLESSDTMRVGTDTIETWYWWRLGVGQTFTWNDRGTRCFVGAFVFTPEPER